MKKWIALPCILLLAAALAAQTDSSATNCSSAATEAAPAQPPRPQYITEAPLPAPRPSCLPVARGTALMVRLDTTLATFSNRVGDPFQAKVTRQSS